MTQLNESRAEVERLRRAVTRKISRLRVRHGAELTGTAFDPRRAPKQHKRYTAKQIETYANEMRNFLSRKTQFVGLAGGKPVPASKMAEYRKKEQSFIQGVNEQFKKYANLPMPYGDETIEQRMEKMLPRHRHMMNRSVNSPYKIGERSAKGIKSPSALDQLIAEMDRRNGGDYRKEQIAKGREQLNMMLGRLQNGDKYKAMADKLTDEQFHVAWNFTSLPDDVSLNYEIAMDILDRGPRAFHEDVYRGTEHSYDHILRWAGKLRLDG